MAIKRFGVQRFSGLEADVAGLPIDADLVGAIFNSTDTLKFWIFDGSTWNESAGGGGITGLEPNSTILEYSTDILDYTTPSNATGTPADAVWGVGHDQPIEDFTTYVDQTAVDGQWITSDTGTIQGNPTTDVLDWQSPVGALTNNIYYDMNALGNLSDTQWVIRFKLDQTIDTFGGTTNNRVQYWFFASSGIGSPTVSTDALGIRYDKNLTSTESIQAFQADNTNPSANTGLTAMIITPAIITRYYEFIRVSDVLFRVNVFTDAGFSILEDTLDIAIPATIVGLRYFQIGYTGQTNAQNNMAGTVDNFELFNNVNSVTGIPVNAIDGNTTTFWASAAGINESITLDMGSVVNNFSLAYYIDKVQTGITETQFQIIDNTTGDILRTVSVADLEDSGITGNYNFIRFNGVNTQFIRVEGSSGSSLVMAANELAVQTETDPPLTTLHGQFTINGTDIALPLNGGDPTSSVIEDPIINTLTMNNVATPNDPASGKAVLWVETVDANNDGVFAKIKVDGTFKTVRVI